MVGVSEVAQAAGIFGGNGTLGIGAIALALIGLVGVALRQRVPLQKVQADSDTTLRQDLMKMLAEAKAEHAADMKAERERCESERKRDREDHAREMGVLHAEIKELRAALRARRAPARGK